MRPITYITADVVVNLVMAIAGMVILILLGLLLYHLKFGGNVLFVLAGFVLCAVSFFACGYVVANVATSARGAQVIGQLFYFPMMFLSGAAIPREFMPPTMRTISNFFPFTHCVTLLQNLWRGDPLGGQLVPTAVIAGLLVAGAYVATRFFRWE